MPTSIQNIMPSEMMATSSTKVNIPTVFPVSSSSSSNLMQNIVGSKTPTTIPSFAPAETPPPTPPVPVPVNINNIMNVPSNMPSEINQLTNINILTTVPTITPPPFFIPPFFPGGGGGGKGFKFPSFTKRKTKYQPSLYGLQSKKRAKKDILSQMLTGIEARYIL